MTINSSRKLTSLQVSSILRRFTASPEHEQYGDSLHLPFNLDDHLIATDSAIAVMIDKSKVADQLSSIKFNENVAFDEHYGRRAMSLFNRSSYKTTLSINSPMFIDMIYHNISDSDFDNPITKISYINTTREGDFYNSGELMIETNEEDYFSNNNSYEEESNNCKESYYVNLDLLKKEFQLSTHQREEFEIYFNTKLLTKVFQSFKDESAVILNIRGGLDIMEVVSDRISTIILPVKIE